ncbi:hypothetical protein P7F88_10970 [Vibrio hannami]|nr:hypothetical protein [Vibrio hannami]MDG3086605.1 hypothetical protein [Vibrio hannami]
MTKMLDAAQDLSVQVHPNDEYANAHENGELGKRNAGISLIAKKTRKSFMAITQNQRKN